MRANRYMAAAVCLAGISVLILSACGGKAFEYERPGEMKSGPGVFSGEDGEFTLYDSKQAAKKKEPAAEPKGGPQLDQAAAAAAGDAAQSDEAKEFEEFQRWKKEKAEFEEFQKWKQTEQGSREYREFQEWQKWREFKKWQENQQSSP